jgi:glycosyltransferase involved in cell wall biosynthesis
MSRPELGTVTKVLIIAPAGGHAGTREVAGPALRYQQLAGELRRRGIEATLATPGPGGDADWSSTSVVELACGQTAVICPQGLADQAAELGRRLPPECVLAVDCYAPALIERALLLPDDSRFSDFRRLVLRALERADLLLVANEPQRAYVLGMLSALGRMAPERPPPPVLLAPMGAPSLPPPTPEPTTPLVLWYGGLWPWFDGATAVQAFALLAREQPALRLRILGGRHPRGDAPDTLDDVLATAASLGVGDRVESLPWVAPEALPSLLAEASCAICLARDGTEHLLAQRTRLLDLLSSGVPFVCTRGDPLGTLAVEAGAATAVPAADPAAAARALGQLLGDAEVRRSQADAGRRLAEELAPECTLAEAVEWLAAPVASVSARRAPSPWRRGRA